MELVWILIGGFGGGVLRGIVGFIKHQFRFKDVGFRLYYFIGMMFLSGIVGVLTAVAVRETGLQVLGGPVTPALAFIIGYAGGDFLENLYKIIFNKTTVFPEK
jgi:hypothetical protein